MANIRDRKLEYYDSLGGYDEFVGKSVLRWVTDDFNDKYGANTDKGNHDVRLC